MPDPFKPLTQATSIGPDPGPQGVYKAPGFLRKLGTAVAPGGGLFGAAGMAGGETLAQILEQIMGQRSGGNATKVLSAGVNGSIPSLAMQGPFGPGSVMNKYKDKPGDMLTDAVSSVGMGTALKRGGDDDLVTTLVNRLVR